MERYWVYIDSRIVGPVEVPALRKLPGFNLLTQVCSEHGQSWRIADEVVDIKSYFLSPPRANTPSESVNVFAAPARAPQTEPRPPDIEAPVSVLDELERDHEKSLEAEKELDPLAALKAAPLPGADSVIEELPAEVETGGSLRVTCEQCNYKNPRDVALCMKCGTPIKKRVAAPAAKMNPVDAVTQAMGIQAPSQMSTASTLGLEAAGVTASSSLPPGTTVELPVTRVLTIAAALFVAGALGFVGYRMHAHKPLKMSWKQTAKKPAVATPTPAPAEPTPPVRRHHKHIRTVHRAGPAASTALTDSPTEETPKPRRHESPARQVAASDQDGQPSADAAASSTPAASYAILNEATPLKHRQHAPIDSPYATKRRADKSLWTEQQKQAIQQVQRQRVYGAQRTIQRNVEILMQILRDREYDTAFETGKRLYLFDDVDWDSQQVDGPVYEVRLTFSGGKESDGLARKPLKFAFSSDLERGTVEPGGSDQIRSNTLHAFFDESRIPPEERRDIARDTEELVQSAQPDASPLAFDTVARHFTSTYGLEAAKRVAQAYGLNLLTRKITHEPHLADPMGASAASPATTTTAPSPARSGEQRPVPKQSLEKPSAVAPAVEKMTLVPSKSGPVEYQMTTGAKRERTITAQASSRATPSHLFEVMTGYDRLKQFVPDLLVSDREGQDGNSTIVHVSTLTRFMFFVFKVNLHLRVIEHPQQHTLEFERIAGEFEQFRGSVEIGQDNAAGPSIVRFRVTIVPKGHMPDWVLRPMAQKFIVAIVDAVRARAEST